METHSPSCPRCGYDLSGAIASWDGKACPMQGLCSECGLTYFHGDVINPWRAGPRWFFEYGEGISIWRLLKTLLRIIWPVGFWRKVHMEHPIRVRRLIAVVALVLLLLHGGVATAAMAIRFFQIRDELWVPVWGPGGPVFPPDPGFADVLEAGWPRLLAALMWPYNVGPRQLWWALVAGPPVGGGLAAVAAFATVVPLSFLLLGDTLRRCRVRPVHLLRGSAWSLPVPAVVGVAAAVVLLEVQSYAVLWLGAAISIAWLSLYWHTFTLRYLRLPHAWGVSAAMITIGLLATACLVLWSGSVWMHLA